MLFMGWFGPRGLASIVLGLVVVTEAPLLGGRDEMGVVVTLTVLLSVLLHGVSAAPLSAVRPPGRRDGRERAGEERNGRVADSCGLWFVAPSWLRSAGHGAVHRDFRHSGGRGADRLCLQDAGPTTA